MAAKAALASLTVLSPLLLIGLALDLSSNFWIVIPGVCAVPVLLIAIGSRAGEVTRLFLMALWLLLSGGWLALWWLSSRVDLGQPRLSEAALVMLLMLVGLGLIPLLLVGLVFARGFGRRKQPEKRVR